MQGDASAENENENERHGGGDCDPAITSADGFRGAVGRGFLGNVIAQPEEAGIGARSAGQCGLKNQLHTERIQEAAGG